MPIFEYACRDCGRQFEYLTREGRAPQCPGCASDQLDKQMSTFAAHAGGSSAPRQQAMSPCGSCGDPRGPGSCSMN